MDNKSFDWKRNMDDESGLEFIVLRYNDVMPENCMQVWIVPLKGSNMCRWTRGNRNIIDFDKKLLMENTATGNPVLYPTPNRVRNGIFMYNGVAYEQIVRGEKILIHGLVRNEEWNYSEPVISDDGVCLKTWIEFNQDSDFFSAFPFVHKLELEFKLSESGVRIAYTISNFDNKTIPYGIAFHPYFVKLSGDDKTYLSIPAGSVMDSTADLLPTGKIIDVEGTIYDVREKTSVGSIDMDNVFTDIAYGKNAEIVYESLGTNVTLKATEEFSHIVLYTPKGKEYFCIENQTCSTDAHNLYEKGLKNESGLEFVDPNEKRSGYVEYVVQHGE